MGRGDTPPCSSDALPYLRYGGGLSFRSGWVASRFPAPQPPLADWEVNFQLFVGGGSGGDGLTFAYGVLDGSRGPLREYGGLIATGPTMEVPDSFEGLSITWQTKQGTLIVRYDGRILGVFKPDGELRNRAWAPVLIRLADARLSILCDGQQGWGEGEHTLGIPIPGYAPRRGWRFGLGASTWRQADSHWVDQLRILSRWLHQGPLEHQLALSLNGQQYVSANVNISYHAAHAVHGVLPTTGPLFGGTTVLVSGVNFRNGDNYTCRFGSLVVPATPLSANVLECVSPERHPRDVIAPCLTCDPAIDGSLPIRVSLNARQYSDMDDTRFMYRPAASVSSIAPASGPLGGGTSIYVYGANFYGGSIFHCAFGDVRVPAAIGGSRQEGYFLQCLSPEANATTAEASGWPTHIPSRAIARCTPLSVPPRSPHPRPPIQTCLRQ